MRTYRAAFGRLIAGLIAGALVGCGGSGYGGDGGSSGPATLSISVEPTTITLGQTATVTWSSNGGACTASGAWSGSRAASGSESVTPTEAGTSTYTLVCSGGGYGDSQVLSATLTVNPTTGFTQTLLVSGFAGTAAVTTDSKLVNPRGIAVAPSGPVRVITSSASTAYDGNGKVRAPPRALAPGRLASTVDPTGIVVNTTPDFVISANGQFGSAEFIYAGKAGMIGGWSPEVDPANAVIMYVGTDGAAYMGLTAAANGTDTFLYATDFRNNKIDVFDASFARQTPSATRFNFSDPTLPDGYAPFGIQAIDDAGGSTRIYVTYARRLSPDGDASAMGAGLGLVNVFDTNGRLLRHLVPAGGALNAPWGIARAPADFGSLSHALLIGNSGDGRIHAYDPASGRFIGMVTDNDGRPIATPGLRGIAFGNDSQSQPRNALFFVAATDQADGTLGRLDPGVMPPALEISN